MTVQDSQSAQIFKAVLEVFEEIQKPIWTGYLIEEEPEEVPPLIQIDNVPVVFPNEHVLVIGKKKSRKSLFIVWLLSKRPTRAMIFDTEQSRRHAWKMGQRITALTGAIVPVFSLRGVTPLERRRIISETVASWESTPEIIVIDGIRDLLSDINSAEESTSLLVWIESLVKKHGIALIDVLHQNKVDSNARGHLGSELVNKAFCTIELSLHKSGVTVVKCESSREQPFNDFAFPALTRRPS